MKKILSFLLIGLLTILGTGCYNKNNNQMFVSQIPILRVDIGDYINLKNIEYDDNTNILEKKYNLIFAKTPGEIVINSSQGKFHVIVNDVKNEIISSAKQLLSINEETTINAVVYPLINDQKCEFVSTDTNIITVNDHGVVKGISEGVARIIISTKNNIFDELTFIVINKEETYYSTILNTIINQSKVENSMESGILEGVYNYNINSLVGVTSYKINNDNTVDSIFGSGIIYKMNIHYIDGAIKEDVKNIVGENNIKEFEYYVITNKHLISGMDSIKVFIGSEYDEIEAEVIASDTKIDISVIKFKSKLYFPIANIGNSDEIEKGEFILSIGNVDSKNNFRSSSFGVVSSTKRYIQTDTDGDNVSDWDSEYIQHDAATNESDSGGAIVNLNGEIVGINSTKIFNIVYNNMSFAIPINLVMDIVSQLEKGVVPKRPILGVNILDLILFSEDPDYYKYLYPDVNIPDGVKYGFYVTGVTINSVADKAGIQMGDIIVGFNGINLKYSYQLRLELGKFLIGSNQMAEINIIRNGEHIVLYVVF